ncbi:hypothetical protein ABZT51_07500 [Streptomyces sp. NPDC005373]|uniref:hypothetical protein n=1 Tax=Streptomyces sp. NPDC005373 TaxID=3156879 RepID=UPI00339DF769
MSPESLIAIITAVIALATYVTSSISAARARIKTIEDAYVARYWQILDRFPSEALVAEQGGPLTCEDERVVRLYLRLCEDELELRQLGWVSGQTWEQWRNGITAALGQWPVAQEWEPVKEGHRAPNQFELLRKLSTGVQQDPFKPTGLTRITRWWRQL